MIDYKRIKELRTKKNYTQSKLSSLLGVSRSAVSMWEIGSSEPDTETISKMAELFGVSTDYLLGREEKPPEKTSDDLSNKIMELFNLLDEKHQKQVVEFTRFVLSLDLDDDKPNS